MRAPFLILALCLLALLSTAQAETYYVAKNGCSDSYAGTEAQPWCTIGKAAATLMAGDTALIRAGTYAEQYIAPANSGSPGQYITFRNYPGETPKIRGTWNTGGDNSSATNSAIRFSSRSYIEISGIEISNYTKCLYMEASNDNIIVRNSYIHDCIVGLRIQGNSSNVLVEDTNIQRISDPYSGCGSSNNGHGGLEITGSSNVTVKNVQSYDNDDRCGTSGDADGFDTTASQNITFIGCVAKNNAEDGFDLSSSNTRIENCIVSGNGAVGFKLWRRSEGTSLPPKDYTIINTVSMLNGEQGFQTANGPALTLYHSVSYANNEYGLRFKGDVSDPQPIRVFDSIISNNRLLGFSIEDSRLQITANYNLYYSNGQQNIVIPGQDANSILGRNPLFANAAAWDFRIQENSPARDTGTDVGVASDLYGNGRPSGSAPDIGAAEFQEGGGAECVDMTKLMGYISQWKTGGITMQLLMEKITRWKGGSGCP